MLKMNEKSSVVISPVVAGKIVTSRGITPLVASNKTVAMLTKVVNDWEPSMLIVSLVSCNTGSGSLSRISISIGCCSSAMSAFSDSNVRVIVFPIALERI